MLVGAAERHTPALTDLNRRRFTHGEVDREMIAESGDSGSGRRRFGGKSAKLRQFPSSVAVERGADGGAERIRRVRVLDAGREAAASCPHTLEKGRGSFYRGYTKRSRVCHRRV